MDEGLTVSRNNIPIRLTLERWFHITEEHSELAGLYFEVLEAIELAEKVYRGSHGELLATRELGNGKYLVVVYRELSMEDGFVITAFMTRRMNQLERRPLVWPQ